MKTALVAALLLASPLFADDDPAEAALKRFFEGQRVVVLLDLPATVRRLRRLPGAGVSPRPRQDERPHAAVGGRAARGRPHSDHEDQGEGRPHRVPARGGGFSSFKDSSGTVSPHVTSKSSFERDLERRVREETDSHRKRELQHELDDLRRERENRDREERERADEINAERRQRDHDRALDMGSRFNIRFEKKDVPAAYKTPEGVMRALGKYVDFLALGPRPPERPEDLRSEPASPGGAAGARVKKGMTRAEVENTFGRPLREDKSREGALDLRVASYEDGGGRFEVTYVDDVVIRVAPLAPR